MFCNVWYVKVNAVDEVPMVVQHTLRPYLLMLCQIEVNIGAYVSRCEVYRLLRSFEHVVRKPVHPMRHLNEVQVARAVNLIQKRWTFCLGAVDPNFFPSVSRRLWNRYDETDKFTRRVGQGRGHMTTPQDDRYLTICALLRRSATAREL